MKRIMPTDAAGEALEIRCPLCGNRFTETEGEACRYCRRLFRTCGMVSCPRCGHEFPKAAARR